MRGLFRDYAGALIAVAILGVAAQAWAQRPGPNDPPAAHARYDAAIRRGCSELWAYYESLAATKPPAEAAAYLQRKRQQWLREAVDDSSDPFVGADAQKVARDALADVACGAAAPDDQAQFILQLRLATGPRLSRRWQEAEAAARKAVDFARTRLPADRTAQADALHELAIILEGESRFDEVRTVRQQEAALRQATGRPGRETLIDPRYASNAEYVEAMEAQLREIEDITGPEDKERIVRDALVAADRRGVPDDLATQRILRRLGGILIDQSKFDAAAGVLQRGLRAPPSAEPRAVYDVISLRMTLAGALLGEHREAEALKLLRDCVDWGEREGNPGVKMLTVSVMADGLIQFGRVAEAEPYARRAMALVPLIQQDEWREHAQIMLGEVLWRTGRLAEADKVLGDALRSSTPRVKFHRDEVARMIAGNVPGVASGERLIKAGFAFNREERLWQARALLASGGALTGLGQQKAARERLADATALIRETIAEQQGARREISLTRERAMQARIARQVLATLWRFDGQAAVGAALVAAQTAGSQAASDALLRAGGRILAARSGAGGQVAEREALSRMRDLADRQYLAAAASGAGLDSFDAHARAVAARRDADARLDANNAEIERQFPAYWDLVAPEPVRLAELQGSAGLLRAGETLVQVSQSGEGVFVFAVSAAKAAWTRTRLQASELDAMVARLRCGLDTAACQSGAGAEPRFDRATAWALYQALFGDPAIAGVLAEGKQLIFIADGALTALPPAVLVTVKPEGDDTDPLDLRETHWLIRDKSIEVLPGLVTLRLLRRQIAEAGAPDPFLGFAPSFGGTGGGRGARVARGADYFSDGAPLLDRLRLLPALSGDIEIEAMRSTLRAPANAVLKGRQASKPQLERLNQSGRLQRARVVAFATHGLVTGDFGLGEPALALTPPAEAAPDDDGLLRASDIAALRMNAEWVVLSACNTGAGETPEAEGLSGLARAFLFAGTRSMLVSHWRVGDDAARFLTTTAIANASERPAQGRAEALRRAELALLDDASLDATTAPLSSPAFWAPFVLIGE